MKEQSADGFKKTEINWFPGHMAKTRRLIAENLSGVDLVIELLDARIPSSSQNPEIDRITNQKPRLTLLTKAALADPAVTAAWVAALSKKNGRAALAVDTVTGEGIRGILPAARSILSEKIRRYEERGMGGRPLRAMIVGIPNVGKSSLVNRLGGGKKAKVEDRPGVTRSKQWVTTDVGLLLLDTPGVLWPKFDDRITGENLAFTGAIRDAVLDGEEIAAALAGRLADVAPDLFFARYKLDREALAGATPWELLSAVAKKRGFLLSGGELDMERAAVMLLDEFRAARIGRISLERPGREEEKEA